MMPPPNLALSTSPEWGGAESERLVVDHDREREREKGGREGGRKERERERRTKRESHQASF